MATSVSLKNISSAAPWALLLDAAVILTNFFLIGYLSREMGVIARRFWLGDETEAGRLLGLALLATFIAQMGGAALKRRPMHARLSAEEETAKKKWRRLHAEAAPTRYKIFFGLLLFMHFVLSLLVATCIPVLLGLSYDGWLIFLILPFWFIPTALVWRALEPPKPDEAEPARWLRRPVTEAVANLCLFSYALINQLFWSALLISNSPLTSPGDVPSRVLQAILLLFPLTVMYFFSPRILFLAEELENPRTRLSMKLAVLSVVLRWVVGADAEGPWLG